AGVHASDSTARKTRLKVSDPRGSCRLALTRLEQTRPRGLDRLGKLPGLAREQQFLPSPLLVAQPLVAARFSCLAAQRPALLLHFEDDVVDPGEVLLCGFQLQL